MDFNVMGSLLVVSSERGMLNVFRLGSGMGWCGPSARVDGWVDAWVGWGYDVFIEKKSASLSCFPFCLIIIVHVRLLTHWCFLALRCEESLCR